MDDLISRQKAIDVMLMAIDDDWEPDYATDRMNDLPSAQPDVSDRKVGEWIIRDNPGTGWYRITCSECGEDVTSNIPVIGFFPNVKPLWNYCPECGADMRGEQDE